MSSSASGSFVRLPVYGWRLGTCERSGHRADFLLHGGPRVMGGYTPWPLTVLKPTRGSQVTWLMWAFPWVLTAHLSSPVGKQAAAGLTRQTTPQ